VIDGLVSSRGHFCFIRSTGSNIRLDSVRLPLYCSRGLKTTASVALTVTVTATIDSEGVSARPSIVCPMTPVFFVLFCFQLSHLHMPLAKWKLFSAKCGNLRIFDCSLEMGVIAAPETHKQMRQRTPSVFPTSYTHCAMQL